MCLSWSGAAAADKSSFDKFSGIAGTPLLAVLERRHRAPSHPILPRTKHTPHALQGVGFVYGALDLIMGGATSPWRRSVAPHVNALGQGPQVYTFPAASLAALPPACQDDLLIQAAAEVLEGTEKDLNRDTRWRGSGSGSGELICASAGDERDS